MHTIATDRPAPVGVGVDLHAAGGLVTLRSPYYELLVVDAPTDAAVLDASFTDVFAAGPHDGAGPVLVTGYLSVEQSGDDELTVRSHDFTAGRVRFGDDFVEVTLRGLRVTEDGRFFVSAGGIGLLSLAGAVRDVAVDPDVIRLPRGTAFLLVNGPAESKQHARRRLYESLVAAASRC